MGLHDILVYLNFNFFTVGPIQKALDYTSKLFPDDFSSIYWLLSFNSGRSKSDNAW